MASRQHRSKAMMVHPDQAARFEERAQKLGIPVEYDRKTGECKGSADALEFEAAHRGWANSEGTNDKALKLHEEQAKQSRGR